MLCELDKVNCQIFRYFHILVLFKINAMPFVFIIFNYNLVLCTNTHSELPDQWNLSGTSRYHESLVRFNQ